MVGPVTRYGSPHLDRDRGSHDHWRPVLPHSSGVYFGGKSGQVVLDQDGTGDQTRLIKRRDAIDVRTQPRILEVLPEMFAVDHPIPWYDGGAGKAHLDHFVLFAFPPVTFSGWFACRSDWSFAIVSVWAGSLARFFVSPSGES